MRKTPTIFKRDPDSPKGLLPIWDLRDIRVELVRQGRAIPTVKFDGTACLCLNGFYYRRHQLKIGKPKPAGWLHWDLNPQTLSGHGWRLVDPLAKEDAMHLEAMLLHESDPFSVPLRRSHLGATFELVGPKIQNNPYRLLKPMLLDHGVAIIGPLETKLRSAVAHTDFVLFHEVLSELMQEGVVWWGVLNGEWQPLGKIKARDFGIDWKPSPGNTHGENLGRTVTEI